MNEPTKEAVEAALALVDAKDNEAEFEASLNIYASGFCERKDTAYKASARILAAEVRRLREDADIYCGWKRWIAGIWRVSHTESGPSAEWLCEEMPPTKVRIGRALES